MGELLGTVKDWYQFFKAVRLARRYSRMVCRATQEEATLQPYYIAATIVPDHNNAHSYNGFARVSLPGLKLCIGSCSSDQGNMCFEVSSTFPNGIVPIHGMDNDPLSKQYRSTPQGICQSRSVRRTGGYPELVVLLQDLRSALVQPPGDSPHRAPAILSTAVSTP